ncbi:MAG: nucleoside triphosphate pyrophosphohydrolase [Bacteroidetes bacterium]|nr:nucleoside triphosphate pyrophosphohydrolase [Bacteroidota bacterium]
MKKTYNKLIRDRIPEIIEKAGENTPVKAGENTPVKAGHESRVRVLDDDEYLTYLSKKLQEEVDEFQEAPSLEELSDILEVVLALAAVQGKTPDDLEALRVEKRERRGSFEKRLLLEWVLERGVE